MKMTIRINEVTDDIINRLDVKIIDTFKRLKNVHNLFYLSGVGFDYELPYRMRTSSIKIINSGLGSVVKIPTILIINISSIKLDSSGDSFTSEFGALTSVSDYENFMVYYRDFKLKTLLSE